MEKFYLKNGEEIHLGDVINVLKKEEYPTYSRISTEDIKVTEKSLRNLIKEGIIVKREEGATIPMELGFYVQKIANRLGLKEDILHTMQNVFPAATLSIILREIAIELDKRHKDHIKNSPKIYVISTANGKITEVNKAHIKNYKNFAAFRTIEDARIACKITRDILKEMFREENEK